MNYINTLYSIDNTTGLIDLLQSGIYEIDILFNYDVSNNQVCVLSFGIDGVNTLQINTNNTINMYNLMVMKTIITVTTNKKIGLYMLSSSDCTLSINCLNIIIKKIE
jgi:hypothetical protein